MNESNEHVEDNIESSGRCSNTGGRSDTVFIKTDVKGGGDSNKHMDAETTKKMEPRSGPASPKTPNLMYGGNGPWKTDIPPTPDGLPLPIRCKTPTTSLQSKCFDEMGPSCSSAITRDLILVSPERRVVDAQDQEERPIVVTPIVEKGPVTSILIHR